jgi:hypothetical protein
MSALRWKRPSLRGQLLTVVPNSTYHRRLKREEPSMPNCIVVVQFDLPKRTEEKGKLIAALLPKYRTEMVKM